MTSLINITKIILTKRVGGKGEVLNVLSSGKGVRLGLGFEGDGGRLGLVLVVILPVTTHLLQCQDFEARHARNKRH